MKQRRPVPPGLTKQEEKVLKKVTRRAHRLDQCINICGIKIGWSAVIGIVPGAGDMIDSFMALMLVWTCMQVKIPDTLKSRMMFNIALDFAIGLVPFLGDIADAFYRCNTRNAALLYKHLEARGAARLREGAAGQRPVSERQPSRTRPSDLLNPSTNKGDQRNAQRPEQSGPHINEKRTAVPPAEGPRPVTAGDLQKLQPVKVNNSQKSRGGGWLSRLREPAKPPPSDLEHDAT